MKAYIKFFFEILPLAVFFTVNSVDNIQIVDTIYNLFFTLPDKFFKATFFLVLTSLIAIPVAWYIDKKVPWMPIVTGIFVLFFGSLTLLLQDPDFIKLKPTIINLVFSPNQTHNLLLFLALLSLLQALIYRREAKRQMSKIPTSPPSLPMCTEQSIYQ